MPDLDLQTSVLDISKHEDVVCTSFLGVGEGGRCGVSTRSCGVGVGAGPGGLVDPGLPGDSSGMSFLQLTGMCPALLRLLIHHAVTIGRPGWITTVGDSSPGFGLLFDLEYTHFFSLSYLSPPSLTYHNFLLTLSSAHYYFVPIFSFASSLTAGQ